MDKEGEGGEQGAWGADAEVRMVGMAVARTPEAVAVGSRGRPDRCPGLSGSG